MQIYKRQKKYKKLFIIPVIIVILLIGSLFLIHKNSDNKIDRISVSKEPSKTLYYIGEKSYFNDIKIEVIKKNGNSLIINADDCEFTGFDSSKPVERQIITVSYKDFTCTFTVSIIDYPKAEPVLQNIYLEALPKTEYKVGESLDTTGGVLVREYQDGSSAKISLINSYVYGFNTSTPGTYTLTVIYIENGLQAQTTYEIVVSE